MQHPQTNLSVMQCNCVSLRKASRRISLYYDACLAPAKLRATQFSMLAVLAQHGAQSGALSVNGLASVLDMDRTTAGQNVKVLERDGLIEVIRSSQDGRARVLHLTGAGRAKLAAAQPLWQQAQAGFEQANGASQAAAMRAMMQAMHIPAFKPAP